MTKQKSTKRALLMSALSLLMCVSMLIGSTFAWFTDEVTSGKNKIQAGNLDVELDYKKVVDGVATEWTTVKDKTDIFNPNALWEPGHVEVVYLRVSNLGSLELKYQLGVNVYNEVIGKTEDGKDIKLSDHLVFKTVETDAFTTYTDREAVKLAAGTEKGLKDYNGKTTALEVGGEDYVTLIVYMPETVGNEANYRGTDVPTIELGINLYATQYTAESDSFGKDYDEDAWVDGMKVYNAADLVSALANEDKVILVNDIATTDVIELKKDVAINLNGKTLSASLDVSDDVEISIENGTIANTNQSVSGIQVNKGNVTLSNVEIASARHAVRVEGGNVTINGGTYKTTGGNGLTQHALNVSDGANVTVNGGTFIGPKGTGADSGAAVNVQADSTVTINGGNFSKGLNNTLAGSGTLIVKGGTFDQNPTAYVADGYKAIENNDVYYVVPNGVSNVVTTAEQLQNALNAATGDTIIILAADITGDVTVTQKEDVNIVVDGKNYKYDGTVTIDGAARYTGAETLKLQNINFETAKSGAVDFISSNVAKYYAHNVTIEGCTFTNKGEGTVVPARFRQAYDITMKDCTVEGTFSPLWATGVTGLTIDNVTANCKNEGINVGTSDNVLIENCKITVAGAAGFGIRADATDAYTLTVNNCDIDAATTIVLRDAVDAYKATVDGVPFVGTSNALQAAINSGATEIALGAGEFTADLYVVPANRNLTITGQGAATKLNFKKGQVRLELFDSLTISNCTMGRMVDKSWGQLVFGSSTQAGGVYTLSNCVFNGEGTQGIYINQNVEATFNIENCTFNGDFGGEGAITIQNNDGVNITVNVTECAFNNIPATSHEIYMLYAYNEWTLNAEGVNAYWKVNS